VNEYQTIMFNMPTMLTQSVRWIGGVMTNWTVKRRAAGGTNPSRLLFTSDSDPAVHAATNNGPAFATFLPRDAWLESYFLPVAPP
jgi:cytochrome c1